MRAARRKTQDRTFEMEDRPYILARGDWPIESTQREQKRPCVGTTSVAEHPWRSENPCLP